MALTAGTLAEDPIVAGTILMSAIVTFPLALFAILAYRRRRTTPYFFVASALVAFLLKAIIGGLFFLGILAGGYHHLIEHALDIAIASMLIVAVYLARDSSQFDVGSVEES